RLGRHGQTHRALPAVSMGPPYGRGSADGMRLAGEPGVGLSPRSESPEPAHHQVGPDAFGKVLPVQEPETDRGAGRHILASAGWIEGVLTTVTEGEFQVD